MNELKKEVLVIEKRNEYEIPDVLEQDKLYLIRYAKSQEWLIRNEYIDYENGKFIEYSEESKIMLTHWGECVRFETKNGKKRRIFKDLFIIIEDPNNKLKEWMPGDSYDKLLKLGRIENINLYKDKFLKKNYAEDIDENSWTVQNPEMGPVPF